MGGSERVVYLACERACLGICTTISEDSGTTRGRKLRECGAMGVISVPAAATQGSREHSLRTSSSSQWRLPE